MIPRSSTNWNGLRLKRLSHERYHPVRRDEARRRRPHEIDWEAGHICGEEVSGELSR